MYKFSRQDYMQGICSHREYYAQMVDYSLKRHLDYHLGKAIAKSKDPNFNDIPLRKWHSLAYLVRVKFSPGDFPTVAGYIYILKEAARQILEGEKHG